MKPHIFSVLLTAKINFAFPLFWLISKLCGTGGRIALLSLLLMSKWNFEKEEKEGEGKKKKKEENLGSVMKKHLIVQLTEGN